MLVSHKSKNLSGVAIITCGLAFKTFSWTLSNSIPPITNWTFNFLLNFVKWVNLEYICLANSLVGEIITVWISELSKSILFKIGNKKQYVFPVPVGDTPTKFHF